MADSTISSTSSSAVSSLIQSQYQQPAISFSGLGSNIDTTRMIKQLARAESGHTHQPAISFSGLGSNIDTTSRINQLVQAEAGQLNQLTTWRDEWTAKISALQ